MKKEQQQYLEQKEVELKQAALETNDPKVKAALRNTKESFTALVIIKKES